MERRIQGTLPNLQSRTGHLTQPLGNGPPVLGLERERFEDQEIERPLGKIQPSISHTHPFCFDKRLTPLVSKRKGSVECPASCTSALFR